ncbi:hypothetical protein GGX14DRAFT_593539 [Mycena pura]|uniref:Uncharacterized protein n=1 Tax=Mycena pura TaxID=153505 RepID=A0AAD6UR95_9AGAR|nr:hypothetical protein GGX14DRAFT_593539 [Mycena pura]
MKNSWMVCRGRRRRLRRPAYHFHPASSPKRPLLQTLASASGAYPPCFAAGRRRRSDDRRPGQWTRVDAWRLPATAAFHSIGNLIDSLRAAAAVACTYRLPAYSQSSSSQMPSPAHDYRPAGQQGGPTRAARQGGDAPARNAHVRGRWLASTLASKSRHVGEDHQLNFLIWTFKPHYYLERQGPGPSDHGHQLELPNIFTNMHDCGWSWPASGGSQIEHGQDLIQLDKLVEPYLTRSVRREAAAAWGIQNEPARIEWSWNTAVQAAARVHGQWNAAVQAAARVHRPVEGGGGAGRRKRACARSQEHARGSGMRRRRRRRGCTGRWKAAAAQSVNEPAQGGRRRQQHGGWRRRRGRRKQVHARSQEHARGQWNVAAQTAAGCTGQWKAAAARSVDNEPAHAHGSVRRECGGGRWKAQRRGATKTSLRTAHGDGAGGVARGGGRRGRCGASKLSPRMLMGGEFGAAAA